MKKSCKIMLPAILLGLSGCKFNSGDDFSQVFLVNGEEAKAGMFPSTLMLSNCTAAKIGPRHFLTAAHCVVYPDVASLAVGPGMSLEYRYGISKKDFKVFNAVVKNVFVHETFMRYLGQKGHPPLGSFFFTEGDGKIADLAVIVLEKEPGAIKEAALGYERELKEGVPITMNGYGCEQPYVYVDVSKRRLKYGARKVNRVLKTAFFAEGTGADPKAPQGCQGDSGGPVYGADGTILGVNSFIGEEGTYFARVDRGAPLPVSTWLQDILAHGADTIDDITGERYALEIRKGIASGVVKGFPDGRFKPKDSVTREQMVVIFLNALSKVMKVQLPKLTAAPFADVKLDSWSAPSIAFVKENGIVKGYDANLFKPEKSVSRAEMLAMLANGISFAKKSKGLSPELQPANPAFAFVDIASHWAKGTIVRMSQYCHTADTSFLGDDTFLPDAAASRAYAVTATLRAFQCLAKEGVQ